LRCVSLLQDRDRRGSGGSGNVFTCA
jgi:hypothetical protein